MATRGLPFSDGPRPGLAPREVGRTGGSAVWDWGDCEISWEMGAPQNGPLTPPDRTKFFFCVFLSVQNVPLCYTPCIWVYLHEGPYFLLSLWTHLVSCWIPSQVPWHIPGLPEKQNMDKVWLPIDLKSDDLYCANNMPTVMAERQRRNTAADGLIRFNG